ncbi:MAG: hypothetical protein KVP17_001786 [Porospora cf. gigantea B]|nr:MAG: hypothetical protein KVP17_001786 [Porospora cf. gigantea B]
MKGAVQSLFSPWLQACAEVDREYTDCQTLWKSLKAVEATLHQQTTKVIALQKEMSLKSSTLKRLNKKSESRDVTEADLKRALASKQAELSKLQVLADAMEGDSVLDTTLTKLRFETENAGRALDSHTQDMLEIDSRRLTLNETIDNLKLQLDTLRGSEQEARHERNGQREKAKSQQRLLEDAESSLRKCTKELKIQLDSFIDRSLVFATEHSALVADVHRHYLGQIHILSAQDRVRSPIEVLRYGLEEEKQGRQSVLTVLTGVLSDLYGVEKEIEDSLQPSSTVEDENQEQHIF